MAERLARQSLVVAIALSLWAVWARPALFALVLAYLAACVLASLANLPRFTRSQPPAVVLALALLGVLPGAATLVRAWPALLEHEGLPIALASFDDRLRLSRLPAIAPALVSSDQPQTFFVHAPGAGRVRVGLAPGIAELAAEPLGEGVFRLDYDPRRDGVAEARDGEVTAQIGVDGTAHSRSMHAVTPLPHPRWLCVAPDGGRAVTVSRETDELVVVSAKGLERRIEVGDAPTDCAFLDATHALVSHAHDASVWRVDVASGRSERHVSPGPRQRRLAVSPDGARLAVVRGGRIPELVVTDRTGDAAPRRAPLPAEPDWLAYGPDAGTLLVATRGDATLHRFVDDGAGLRRDRSLVLGRPAVTLARLDDGAKLLLSVTDFRRDGRRHLGNHFVQDQLLEVDVASLRVTRRLLTARRTPRQSRAGDVDSGLSPMGLAPRRGGGVLVALAGSDELWSLARLDAEPKRLDLARDGVLAPHGVAELGDGTVVVTSPSQGLVSLRPPGGAARTLRLSPDDATLRARAPEVLARRRGEHGFYEGTRAGVSCQSCHLHADSDAAAHNLGDRQLLPTLTVRGLFATAPYLRDGTYGHLRDLDWVARTLYRGYLRRAPGRAHVLGAYLRSLPRTPSAVAADERDPEAERRGLRAFVLAGCPRCHAPPAFSGLGQHRPSALFPNREHDNPYALLDAPSLLSVGATAPYLDDGRAATLAEVLTEHNRANHHGDVTRLSEAQRDDLIRFLEAL